jgi:hypothetical protein
MLNPKHRRYANRINALIKESRELAALEKPSSVGSYIQDEARLNAWLVKLKNIIEVTFGQDSQHYKQMLKLTSQLIENAYQVQALEGLLLGALDDLENGFLVGQEFLIAGEVFDSVLEEAKYLNQSGHKDPAAVLTRVVLEDALKRLAISEGINDNQKASQINDELRKQGRYPQPQWRLIRAWLDMGNAAAHGKFDEYTSEDVQRLVEDIERFLASEFRS